MMDENRIKKKAGGSATKKRATSKNRNQPVRVSKQAAHAEYLLDHMHDAVVILDMKGRLKSMNAAAKTMLGRAQPTLKLEDWPGKFGLYEDDGVTPLPVEKLAPYRALNGLTEAQQAILHKNGSKNETWLSIDARPMSGAKGAVRGLLVQLRDVTERKRAERNREREARWMEAFIAMTRIIAESAHDTSRISSSVAHLVAETLGDMCIVTLLNANGEKITVSSFHDVVSEAAAAYQDAIATDPEYSNDTGLAATVIRSGKPLLISSISREEMLSITAPKFTDFVRRTGIYSVLVVPLTGRRGIIGTIILFRHQPGRPYDTADQSFMMEIARRTALAMESSILIDSMRKEMAERASTKQALHASEERFRAIFEMTTLGMKVLDPQGTILQTNPAFQNMLGYPEGEFVGRNFYDFLHPDDLERAMAYFNNLKISGVPESHFEHRTLHKDGSVIWARTTFTVVTKGGGDNSLAFIVGIVENITQRKLLEGETLELKSRLQNNIELERLRLARELHDGPMQELYSVIYRLEELRPQAKTQVADTLDTVNSDIQKVLQNLRATAKELRPPTISNFGLEKALRSEAQDFQDKHPGIKVELSLAQDRQILPEEVRMALFRVFQQCLANVAKHAQATEVRVHFSFDVEESHLEVHDNGKGFQVPPNWIEFVRNGHYGLAGAAERVSALGGILTVESAPKRSTIVRAVIPWQDSAGSASESGQETIAKRANDLI